MTRLGGHSPSFFTSQCSLRSLFCQKETTTVAGLRQTLGAVSCSMSLGGDRLKVLLTTSGLMVRSSCKPKAMTVACLLLIFLLANIYIAIYDVPGNVLIIL